jgi:hypothetical protein
MPSLQPSAGGLLYKIGLARTQKRVKRNATKPYVFIDSDDNPLQLHSDDLPEGQCCYCLQCIEDRNAPSANSKSSFRDDMLRLGFTDADTSEIQEHIGSDFFDDVVFLLNRIHSLPSGKLKPDYWPVDDSTIPLNETITPPTPETWTPPQIQIEYARYGLPFTKTGRLTKSIITNVRCMACGAVDKQKYPKMNLQGSSKKQICSVDSEYLCSREACVRSRGIKQDFDARRLRSGYPLHPHFVPAVHKTLISWVRSQGKSEGDPNLKCDLRYAVDTRGRRGIKAKTSAYKDRGGDSVDSISDVAQVSGIYTADSNGSFAPLKGMTDRNRFDSAEVRYFENDFAARIKDVVAIRPVVTVTPWQFDPSIHKIVHDRCVRTFEEKRYLPNYNCFGPVESISDETPTTAEQIVSDLQPDAKFDSVEVRDFGVTKTGVWAGDPLLWTPGHGLSYPLIPHRLNINKLDELTWRQKVKVPFDGTKVITTLRDTTGAADEIRKKQIKKLRERPVPSYVQDIYLKGKKMKQAAEEQGVSVNALKQKLHRELNKPVLTEAQQWTRAIESSNCDQDGIYAIGILNGRPRAYLILPWGEFTDSSENNEMLIEERIHNLICDLLERRIRNGRGKPWCMTDEGCQEEYKKLYYEAFKEFSVWRTLREGTWYQENQTEVPVLSLT